MTEGSLSMDLVIFSCSPRAKNKSNTATIMKAFLTGYESEGKKAVVYYLNEKDNWEEYRKIFYESNEMLFAMPLFVECIPGLLMEFLESLEPKVYNEGEKRTRIAFLLQGGFAEANQLRTGERYLEKLPGYLNCNYAGTLIKGNMFGIFLAPEDAQKKMVEPFIEMGKEYGKTNRFDKDKVTAFAAPEHFSKFKVFYMNIIMKFLGKIIISYVAKKQLGAKENLNMRPYQNEL